MNKIANQSPQSVDLFCALTNRPEAATIHNNISITLITKKKTEVNRKKLNKEIVNLKKMYFKLLNTK